MKDTDNLSTGIKNWSATNSIKIRNGCSETVIQTVFIINYPTPLLYWFTYCKGTFRVADENEAFLLSQRKAFLRQRQIVVNVHCRLKECKVVGSRYDVNSFYCHCGRVTFLHKENSCQRSVTVVVPHVKIRDEQIGGNGEGCTSGITNFRIKAGTGLIVLYSPDRAMSF